mmetsp:Transcript_30049/g.52760  ORF Transcript_30049/g.52760 Transcript_30049/m.52760 type:complete len:215 (+) Transcript_30049:946-1590(+)
MSVASCLRSKENFGPFFTEYHVIFLVPSIFRFLRSPITFLSNTWPSRMASSLSRVASPIESLSLDMSLVSLSRRIHFSFMHTLIPGFAEPPRVLTFCMSDFLSIGVSSAWKIWNSGEPSFTHLSPSLERTGTCLFSCLARTIWLAIRLLTTSLRSPALLACCTLDFSANSIVLATPSPSPQVERNFNSSPSRACFAASTLIRHDPENKGGKNLC